jgi:EAL domain-containing protein (putative c-di-GMP-specific phosphodiesterase class I)
MNSIPHIGRVKRKPQRGRKPGPAREQLKRARSPRQSNPKSTDDGILVVEGSGKIGPLNRRFAEEWKIPQSGKTMPLNQRFARMWQIPRNILERLSQENGLRHAMDREEFTVYYQPQAQIETDRIVAAEALVRWQHPDRGLVEPDEFIPLAEDTGLIVRLGEWVLRAACTQNRSWQEAGLPALRVSVNLSARQFQEPGLVEMVAGALTESRLDPEWLELEITERTAMQNADHTASVLREIRGLGVRISIDDFGTGYSSLGYLNRFPINTLKIDRSFVGGLTHKPDDEAIASAIIAMAQSLGLDVVAEGVETDDQLDFLKQRRCQRFQGNLLGEPLPAGEFHTLLERRAVFSDNGR